MVIFSVVLTGLTTLFVQGTNAGTDLNHPLRGPGDGADRLDKMRREVTAPAPRRPTPASASAASHADLADAVPDVRRQHAGQLVHGQRGSRAVGAASPAGNDLRRDGRQMGRLPHVVGDLPLPGLVDEQLAKLRVRFPVDVKPGDNTPVRALRPARPAEQHADGRRRHCAPTLLSPPERGMFPARAPADPRRVRDGFLRLRTEGGFVLPVALGILAVLSIAVVVVVDSSSSSARNSTRSGGDKVAFALRRGGREQLHGRAQPPDEQRAQAADARLLRGDAETTWNRSDYEGGYVLWCGTFNASGAYWTSRRRHGRNTNGRRRSSAGSARVPS